MTTNPSVTIDTHSAPDVDADRLASIAQGLRDQFPDITVRINPSRERLLDECTRRYAPEIAAALDAGDVQTAAKLLLERIEARMDA